LRLPDSVGAVPGGNKRRPDQSCHGLDKTCQMTGFGFLVECPVEIKTGLSATWHGTSNK
jgi:hypothetical protein